MVRKTLCAFALATSMFTAAASAAPQLDQSSTPTGTTNLYNTGTVLFSGPTDGAGQSVTAGLTGTLARIAFGITGSGTATLTLYQAQQGPFYIGPIYSQTVTLPGFEPTTGEFDWSTLPSWDVSAGNIAVTAGQKLYFSITPAQEGNGVFSYYNNSPFSYDSGQSTYRVDYGFVAVWQDIGVVHSFQTYVDTAAAAVPEPATWALMVLGFGALGATMRRRGRRTGRVATTAG